MSKANLYGYRHSWLSKKEFRGVPCLPKNILCIAKNYPSSPEEKKHDGNPFIFSKCLTSLIPFEEPILLNGRDDVHYETDLALLIGKHLHATKSGHDLLTCCRSVSGLGVALDLTLKSLQNDIKARGGPWELAKAFDRSCPLSPFVSADANWWETPRTVELSIDGQIVQKQSTSEMIYNCGEILQYITQFITLSPGDVVLTGTPSLPRPTQPLKAGQRLIALVDGVGSFETKVVD